MAALSRALTSNSQGKEGRSLDLTVVSRNRTKKADVMRVSATTHRVFRATILKIRGLFDATEINLASFICCVRANTYFDNSHIVSWRTKASSSAFRHAEKSSSIEVSSHTRSMYDPCTISAELFEGTH